MSTVETIQSMLNANSQAPSAHKSELDKDDFLKLMIAQLKYQDPMDPLDGSEYSAQLAQFSSLEQLQNMNTALETSIGANYQLSASVNNTMAATLIGKDVKLGTSTINFNGQDSAAIGYELPDDAKSVEVNIYNASGALIKTIKDLPTDSGEHKLSWDFTDNDGKNVDVGNYSYTITAYNTNSKEMTFDNYLVGNIKAVRYTDDGTKLVVNDVEYSLDQITEIVDPELDSNEDD